jgi:cellulose synthase/poly-beta-1,6-N-acetylglucosamine synthase-like glycosyltransferase
VILCFQILPISIHDILLFLSILILLVYFFVWKKISKNFCRSSNEIIVAKTLKTSGSLSVIIPFRNEATRIQPLLESILRLKTSLNLEFLFIDDHSTDQSIEIIQNHPVFSGYNCRIIQLNQGVFGKKNAIQIGVQNASNSTILTTDADCQFQETSVEILYAEFSNHDADFCIGPVFFHTSKSNPFQFYQKIENTILVALGLYQFNTGKPTMANGANLMFNRALFLKLNPFQSNQNIAGGDDIFALEAFYLHNSKKVISVANPNAAVYTNVVDSFREFWQQRVRWIRKTMSQKTKNTAKSQILLALFFVIFWGLTLISLFQQHYEIIAILWLGKLFSDVFCIRKIFKTFNQNTNFKEILFASIYQNLFIPALGAFSAFQKSVHWKNRTY